MTVVSTKEFNTNQKRYFELAKKENICIKRGKNMFIVTYSNNNVDCLSTRKKTGLEEALDDVANGRLTIIHTPTKRVMA